MKKWVKILIIVAVATLVSVGAVYAYDVLWSGTARITIEEPTGATGSGQLVITGVEAISNGSWNDANDTWTVSIARGESASLKVEFENTGGDIVTYFPYIDGHELQHYIADGVRIQTTGDLSLLAAGETGYIQFRVDAQAEAESGTIPDIELEIR